MLQALLSTGSYSLSDGFEFETWSELVQLPSAEYSVRKTQTLLLVSNISAFCNGAKLSGTTSSCKITKQKQRSGCEKSELWSYFTHTTVLQLS